MHRPFVAEELRLSNAAKKVRGEVHADRHRTPEQIVDEEYQFPFLSADQTVEWNTDEHGLATEILSQTLNADFAFGVGEVMVTINAHSPRATISKGQQVLADYLQSPREKQAAVTDHTADKSEPIALPSTFQHIASSG